jgi:dihydrofolate reductase
MSNVFLYMTMSLDGFVAGPDGELDWMTSTQDPELTADIVTLLRSADAGFIGYPTAVGMIQYWADAARNPSASPAERDIADAVNRMHAYVVSRKEEHLTAANAELLLARDDAQLVAAVKTIKNQASNDLGVPGGVRTAQTFARLGLIDEYVFLVHPIAIGAGQRVFPQRTQLSLTSTKSYTSGIVRLNYLPA